MKYSGLKYFFACLCAVSLLAACSKDGEQGRVVPNGTDGTLLPISDRTVHPLGDEFKVAYTSDTEWELINSATEWIKISPTEGTAGTTEMTITVAPNVRDDRSHQIKFNRGDSFTISQDCAILQVNGKQNDSYSLGWKKTEGTFTVTSNVEWRITLDNREKFSVDKDGEEVKVDVGKTKEENLSFASLTNNLDTEDAHARITLVPVKRDNKGNEVDVDIDLQATVDLTQDYLYFLVEGSRYTQTLKETFSELGARYLYTPDNGVDVQEHVAEQTIEVWSEAEWTCVVPTEYESWGIEVIESEPLESVEIAGTKGRTRVKKTLTVSVMNPNPGLESRWAGVSLCIDEDTDARRDISFEQDPYQFEITDEQGQKFDNMGGEGRFTILTTGPWSLDASSVPSWMSVEPTSGVGTTELTVRAPGQNLNFDDNECTLNILSSLHDGGSIKDETEFTQDRFIFDVGVHSDFSGTLSRLDTGAREVTVTSSGPWTLNLSSAEGDAAWLDVMAVSGADGSELQIADNVIKGEAGDWTIWINANSPNESETQKRTKSISITSDRHDSGGSWPSKAKKDFNVTQDEYVFRILSLNTEIVNAGVAVGAYKPSGITNSIKFECGAPWRIISMPEWVDADMKADGSGQYRTVNFYIAPNIGEDWASSRGNLEDGQCVVVRSYKSATSLPASDEGYEGTYEDKKFYFAQEAFVFAVEASDLYEKGALDTGVEYFTVTSTDEAGWTVSADSPWVKHNTSGTGTGESSFSLYQNSSTTQTRTAAVTVRSTVVNESRTFNITQDKYRFNSDNVTLGQFTELNPVSGSVDVDCMGAWYVVNKPSWITLSSDSGNGNATVTVSAAKNVGEARGPVDFYFQSDVADYNGTVTHRKKVTVSQRDFVWDVTSITRTISADVLNGGSGEIKFYCSGAWTAESSAGFVTLNGSSDTTVSKNNGRDSHETITVTVAPNYTTSYRTATVTVRSDDHSGHNTRLNVSQPQYDFKVGDPSGETIASGGGAQAVSVSCTGILTAVSDQSWLTTKIEGGVLTVTAAKNTEYTSRTASVTVSSEHLSHNSALTKTITFTQDGAPKPDPEPEPEPTPGA